LCSMKILKSRNITNTKNKRSYLSISAEINNNMKMEIENLLE